MQYDQLKSVIEGLLFAAGKPMSLDQLARLLPEVQDKAQLREALEQLRQDYAERGVELVEVGSGYRFQVRQCYSHWVGRLWEEKPPRYSRATLETLALIAYRQPITRGEIEEIRGVSVSSNIIKSLLEREWIRVIGHRDIPGRPALYATTRQFLDYFNLSSLEQLPPLSEIRDIEEIARELEQQQDQALMEANQAAETEAGPA